MSNKMTTVIVNGYARDTSKHLPVDNPYYNITLGLVKIISKYIKNFVENSGMHHVQINNPDIISAMLSAGCDEKFELKLFMFISYTM